VERIDPKTGEATRLSASSVRNYTAPLRAILADAVEDGKLRTNPARQVSVGRKNRREGRRAAVKPRAIRALTDTEAAAVVAATPEPWRFLVRFILATGLRDGHVSEGKTAAARRVVPVAPGIGT
jgi:integrase